MPPSRFSILLMPVARTLTPRPLLSGGRRHQGPRPGLQLRLQRQRHRAAGNGQLARGARVDDAQGRRLFTLPVRPQHRAGRQPGFPHKGAARRPERGHPDPQGRGRPRLAQSDFRVRRQRSSLRVRPQAHGHRPGAPGHPRDRVRRYNLHACGRVQADLHGSTSHV